MTSTPPDLDLCYHYPPGLLVESLVVPVRVEVGELGGQSVVFPHPDGVVYSQARLLVTPAVSCNSNSQPALLGSKPLFSIREGKASHHHIRDKNDADFLR